MRRAQNIRELDSKIIDAVTQETPNEKTHFINRDMS
jgi:hypothetical protein